MSEGKCYGGVKYERLGNKCPKCGSAANQVCGYIGSHVAKLEDRLAEAKKAADAILAPLTMEVGRLMEDAPSHEIVITAFGEEIKLTAKHFMDLYRATDTDE